MIPVGTWLEPDLAEDQTRYEALATGWFKILNLLFICVFVNKKSNLLRLRFEC